MPPPEAIAMTASQILAIPSDRPDAIFTGDAETVRARFAALVKRWHPDHNDGLREATLVFNKIVALHEKAKLRLGADPATAADALRVKDSAGRSFDLTCKVRRPFELGELTVSHTKVGFVVDRSHNELFENGIATLRSIRYPDAKVRIQMERFFPAPRGIYETRDAKVAVFDKSEDIVVLSDLIAHMGGALPAKHMAWVVSSLLNLCCFLEVCGLTNNAISPETVLVTPTHHAAFTLSWWYAARAGSRVTLLPPSTFDLVPPSMARDKSASIRLDLESVRAVGLACLGDPTGASLIGERSDAVLRTAMGRIDVPSSVSTWLRLPPAASAIDDYRSWSEMALPGFGPRRFLKLRITSRDIYI